MNIVFPIKVYLLFCIINIMLFLSVFCSRNEVFDEKRDSSDLAGIYSAYLSQQLSDSSKFNSLLGALIMEPGNLMYYHYKPIPLSHFENAFSDEVLRLIHEMENVTIKNINHVGILGCGWDGKDIMPYIISLCTSDGITALVFQDFYLRSVYDSGYVHVSSLTNNNRRFLY